MKDTGNLSDRRISAPAELDGLTFDANGLLPVVVQDAGTRAVLMVAWANRDALVRTLETGETHFWSRSREELWHKGATSGNTQTLVSLHADCDSDTLLALVNPRGPACHTDEATCFGALGDDRDEPGAGRMGRDGESTVEPLATGIEAQGETVLPALWAVLESRARELPEGSYTSRLLQDENLRLKKLGEETAELILALSRQTDPDGESRARAVEEAGDLLYHLLAALLANGITLDDLLSELDSRRG